MDKKIKKQIRSILDKIKHYHSANINEVTKIQIHLRDYHRTSGNVQITTVSNVINELLEFNIKQSNQLREILIEIDKLPDNILME